MLYMSVTKHVTINDGNSLHVENVGKGSNVSCEWWNTVAAYKGRQGEMMIVKELIIHLLCSF